MTVDDAYLLMIASLHAADATRGQVNGVFAWRDAVAAASALAARLGQSGNIPGGETPHHDTWMSVCGQITAALRTQENTAELLALTYAGEAEQAAAERDECRARAAWHEQMRDRYRAAAPSKDDPGHTAAMLALADEQEALRQQAANDAADAEDRRVKAAAKAALAGEWRQAANDAAGAGQLLTVRQDADHGLVVTAVTDAGPVHVAAVKWHYQTEGSTA